MSATEFPSAAACPGCLAAPVIAERAVKTGAAGGEQCQLVVPSAHCATCISTLENGLQGLAGVNDARLNLSTRRLTIRHDPSQSVESLIEAVGRLGYQALPLDMVALSDTETERQSRDLVMRLGVAFFAMMNIMLLSVAVWSGASDATRDLFHLLSGAIAIPTVIFAGQPFFKSAWASLRAGRLGMDVPISLALILATSISVFETFMSGEHAYFDAAVMLSFFLLGGRYLDHRTRAVARSAAQELAALEVPRALRVDEGGDHMVAVSALVAGDLVRVLPGGRVPVDGTVTEGMTEMDRSLLTGESLPLRVGTGDKVHAGEVNLTGPLTLRVTAAGRDTALGRMADLVALAETTRNKYTSLADRAARAYSPLVHLLSFSAFGVWMYLTGGDWRFAINISAAVLIITCPCALGLAVPAVVTAASGKLYRKGLLIKSATALERLAKVDTVVFDKTGTLTLGTPVPVGLEALSEADRALALGLAEGSAHPLAKGLVATLRALGTTPAVLTDLREVPGHGIEARLGKTRVRLGRAEWVGAAPGDLTATWLSRGGAAPLEIPFTDSLRPGAEALVARLKAEGFAVHLISGDTMGAVADIAARLGIDSWQDSALPEAKAAFIRDLTSQGRQVLMVGDGLNDTVALTEAAVSISPASALDAARVASDMVLTGQGLEPVADALRISKQAVRRIKENFGISAAYNIVAVPVALIGLATPLMAAAAMSLSSITVTLNALRMK